MKKILLVIAVLFFSVQSQAQIAAGGGISFGLDSDFGNAGINLRGMYTGITDEIDGVLGINIFFPTKFSFPGGETKFSIFTINFDGHYNFEVGDGGKVYPLAGLNITVGKVTVEQTIPFFGTQTAEASETDIGLNFGGGGSLAFSDVVTGFAEIKYVLTSDFDQPVGTAGILVFF